MASNRAPGGAMNQMSSGEYPSSYLSSLDDGGVRVRWERETDVGGRWLLVCRSEDQLLMNVVGR